MAGLDNGAVAANLAIITPTGPDFMFVAGGHFQISMETTNDKLSLQGNTPAGTAGTVVSSGFSSGDVLTTANESTINYGHLAKKTPKK